MSTTAKQRRELFSPAVDGASDDTTFWLIPYGNMMTILMIFFLVMYAFSKMNKWKVKKITHRIEESLKDREYLKDEMAKLGLLGEFRNFIYDNNLRDFTEISANARRIQISMQAPVLFLPGKDKLKEEGKVVLEKIARLIEAETGDVRIAGHTDDTPVRSGRYKDNWELSALRAHNVVRYLTTEQGLLPIRFSMIGYGEFSPVVPNDTAAHRAENRRIEVNIIKRKRLFTAAEIGDIQ